MSLNFRAVHRTIITLLKDCNEISTKIHGSLDIIKRMNICVILFNDRKIRYV